MKPPEKPTSTALVPVKVTEVELLRPHERPQKPLAEDVIEAWTKGRRAATLAAYKSDLEDWRKWLRVDTQAEAVEILLADKGKAHRLCLDYVEHMQKRGLKPATISRKIKGGVTAIVKMARIIRKEINWTLEVPVPKVENARDTSGPGDEIVAQVEDYFSREVARARAPAEKLVLARDYAIVKLMNSAGFRRGEISSLDVSHVEVQKRRILALWKGKDERKPIDVPLQTIGVIQQYMNLRAKDLKASATPALFVALSKAHYGKRLTGDGIHFIIRGLEERLGIKVNLRPHGWRHTAVSKAVEKMSFMDAVSFARHSNPKTTMVYVDNLAKRAAAAAQAVADSIDEDVAAYREKRGASPTPGVDPVVREKEKKR